ncbi:MAG: hypothetical protein LC633_01410 [Desulfobulbaceae bacterium]|nr:hypothetical protein [Desulfobulbaceae bacterium]
MTPDLVISPEVARELAGISREIGRQIGLLVDRAIRRGERPGASRDCAWFIPIWPVRA